jgi:hypothetical protein
MTYVTDTHSIVWYFSENPRLSRSALDAFESTADEGVVMIPAVVLAEIMGEEGRPSRLRRDYEDGR